MLARNAYGWSEHVAAGPCETEADVEAFYERCGGLLCLLSLLQATDIHYENLVASGADPVVVDLETLFHPMIVSTPEGEGSLQDFQSAIHTTGLMPNGEPDFSAFGATGAVATPFPTTRCDGINSDALAVTRTLYRAPRRDNVPIWNGRQQTADAYQDAVAGGFEEMYRLVLRHRGELTALLLRTFGVGRSRVVIRSSNIYGLVLQESLQPSYMRDERLRASLLARFSPQEVEALERLDVPCLTVACDASHQGAPPALEQVIKRIALLTSAQLPAQIQFIRRDLAKLRASQPVAAAEGEMNG